MATTKFKVGKMYITMADKFGDGEQTGKSVVIERTAGTVTFKHLASGEIFVREVQVFDAVQVEGCDGLDAMDNFIADNFGEEITTADIEPIEQVAEIESVENTAETEQVEKAKVEVCKAYDAKDIIAACYPAEIAEIDAEEKTDAVDIATDDSAEIEKAIYDKFHKIFGYKELIIGLEGDIAKMEKLNELYAEEYELRLANGYPADGMELLTAKNDEVIGKRKAKIAEYQQKLEVEKAELERLKNKLAALKNNKVAA